MAALVATIPEAVRADSSLAASFVHHGRGIVLTLCACKAANPAQDIRAHQAQYEGGISARTIDSKVVVPLLRKWNLRNAAESHWTTQGLVQVAFQPGVKVKSSPAIIGEVVPRLVCGIQDAGADAARLVLRLILCHLIAERNKGAIPLTKPKGVTIARALRLLEAHFGASFKTGGPRLPQLAVYAAYECLLKEVARYSGHTLVPLERLKTANRKSGTVGDVDVLHETRTVEAVEIKFGMSVDGRHVSDAIEKIKAADVRRYYILATGGIKADEEEAIAEQIGAFYRSNGCEIIVNGIFETIRYYLRLIGSVDEFIARYVDHLASDDDLSYEHRIAWNAVCEEEAVGE
jgi:DNA (cytosine-5)-methyltransferase 1